jgi:hypothetical protein
MKNNVALIIVFNHRYDKNIPVLESIYEGRFSNIYYLVPFYDGDTENVIPVYENSFQFQGYMAQGFGHYFNEDYEHYLFIADDLLLNPAINETNYKGYFNLTTDASFIPEIHSLHNLANNDTLRFIPMHKKKPGKWYWWRLKQLVHYSHGSEGVESKTEMPPYTEAEKIIRQHGYDLQPLLFEDVFGSMSSFADKRTLKGKAKHLYKRWKHRKGFALPYPVVGSYSDIVIVAQPSIKKFIHYCGVFAANGLFVEFAVPTALLLSSQNVMTEPKLNAKGLIYWAYTKEEAANYASALKPYNNNLASLLNCFPKDKLYIHPIKLSKWNLATVKER